ncbi:hypothetical protein [Neobacillus drentensis]|uniref:hypothetical protein n=1 Tax=Neobacillus drentensis TaxID=220684 RepID=UPI002FFF0297
MIILTQSHKSTRITKAVRDFIEATALETVSIVPFGIKKIVISEDPVTGQFSVHSWDREKELCFINGFLDFESSFEHAKSIAKYAGIPIKDIELNTCSYVGKC